LDCAVTIWNSWIACMDVFLNNDDSSSRCVLKHPIPMQILKDLIKSWLVDKHGKNIKCTGWLPAEINPIRTYLVDPSHWHCVVYGSHLYKLERNLKEMKKTDCKCLICNFGYAVKQNCKKTKEEFPKAMMAAMEHPFDNHEFCNPSWCHFWEDSIQKSDWCCPAMVNSEMFTQPCKSNCIWWGKKIHYTWKLTHVNASFWFTKEWGFELWIHKTHSKEYCFLQNIVIFWPSCLHNHNWFAGLWRCPKMTSGRSFQQLQQTWQCSW